MFPGLAEHLQTACLILPPSLTVVAAIAEIAKAATSFALIVEDEQIQGILTERDIVRLITSQQTLTTLSLSVVMTREVITLRASELTDIFQVSQLFGRYRVRHLPVVDQHERLLGMLTPQSIRRLMKPEYLLRHLRVEEVMVNSVVQGAVDESVMQIAQKMTGYRVSCIVIVDAINHVPLGIITERDITQFHVLGLSLTETAAGTVMSTPLTTVQPQDSLWCVHERMHKLRVHRLVVVEPTGKLAGIVTQTQMIKLLNPAELYQVMEQMQQTIEQQTQQLRELNRALQVANEELGRQASLDKLTQLSNRRRFDEYLAESWQRLSQLQGELTLILCDVDNFKAYNDTYGHVQGDACLARISQALKQTVRSSTDLVARYGGEEFAMVLPECGVVGAKRVLENIFQQIDVLKIPHTSSNVDEHVTMSLGAAVVRLPCASSPTNFLQLADKQLYESKHQGRNQFSLETLS
ncbi:MAG: diguanylate cyclase domain-containing protein [Leptolyngbyaceae cyanobacterium]